MFWVKRSHMNFIYKILEEFKINIIKLNLKIDLFAHIINYLNNKLQVHNNELQYCKA